MPTKSLPNHAHKALKKAESKILESNIGESKFAESKESTHFAQPKATQLLSQSKILESKILAAFFALSIPFAFSGCLADKNTQATQKPITTLKCQKLGGIAFVAPNPNELNIDVESIEAFLYPKLDELCDKLDNAYPISVDYSTTLDSALSTTNLTQTETKIATLNIEISFNNVYVVNGKAQIEVKAKKILDIGESAKIDESDKQTLIKAAINAALEQLTKRLDKQNKAQS